MVDINMSGINPIEPVKSSIERHDEGFRDIRIEPSGREAPGLHEGQLYRGKVSGFADGGAIISVNDNYVMASKETGLVLDEQVSLKFIRQEADGSLLFKLIPDKKTAGGDGAKSRSDLLERLGLDSKGETAKGVLDSFMKFGMILDRTKMESVASDVLRLAGKPEVAAAMKNAPATSLSDISALLRNSGLRPSADSASLGIMLLASLDGFSGDFTKLFALAPLQFSNELIKLIPDIEKKNKELAKTARKIASIFSKIKKTDGPGLLKDLGRALAEGIRKDPDGRDIKDGSEDEKGPAICDIIKFKKFLEKELEAGGGTPEAAKLIEGCAESLENYAMLSLYGELSNRHFTKLPLSFDGEEQEALIEFEKSGGEVKSVDVYLSMTSLGPLRVNLKKGENALGVYLFVAGDGVRDFLMSAYDEVKNSWNDLFKVPHNFSIVKGAPGDFHPGILKHVKEKQDSGGLDLSV